MKPYLLISLFVISLFSCSSVHNKDIDKEKSNYSENRQQMEYEANQRLNLARHQLKNQMCKQAKQTIENMRKDCYLAISARKLGLLLMDSVDLCLAKQELAHIDSLMSVGTKSISQENFEEACRKVQFYERKIHYDKNRLLEKDVK